MTAVPVVDAAASRAAFARRDAPTLALGEQAPAVARACRDMAARFQRGGKLLVFGTGTRATDAQHVAVEFVHPVIVGKRALPAISLVTDAATLSGVAAAAGVSQVFAHQLRTLGGPDDIALGLYGGAEDPAVSAALEEAAGAGMLTVALAGGEGASPGADHVVVVASGLPYVVKEAQVTLYHVLWELVHIFFEQSGALSAGPVAGGGGEPCITCSDQANPFPVVSLLDGALALVDTGSGLERVSVALVDAKEGDVVLVHAGEAIALVGREAAAGPSCAPGPSGGSDHGARDDGDLAALYPFLYQAEGDAAPDLLADVARSTEDKVAEILALRRQLARSEGDRLAECALAMAGAFARGGRLFSFGNGGSSSDAQAVAHAFMEPPAGRVALPALCLTNDVAVLTALANDIGFQVVFSRQVAAWGRPGDIAVGLSTSGGSANVLAAFEEARRIGMLTVGMAGYDGGKMADAGIDHLFVIPSSSVHRIQEAQTTLYHVLAELVGEALAGGSSLAAP